MQKSKIYVFLFDGYSDWEAPYAMAEINKSDKYQLLTFSTDKKPVRSVGGLTVIPDATLQEIDLKKTAMIILPGGLAWEENKNREIIPLLDSFNKQGGKVAAICGATTVLGHMGLLENIKHTSNAKFYLQHYVPSYKGDAYYVEEPAVTDGTIITATGTAPVEFAREIFKALSLMDDENIEKWFQLFKNGVWTE